MQGAATMTTSLIRSLAMALYQLQTANRFFVKPRMVKIISCHGQTSGYGSGGHDYHINITPLFAKQNALPYAKSVLFIDNGQSKIVKDCCVGNNACVPTTSEILPPAIAANVSLRFDRSCSNHIACLDQRWQCRCALDLKASRHSSLWA